MIRYFSSRLSVVSLRLVAILVSCGGVAVNLRGAEGSTVSLPVAEEWVAESASARNGKTGIEVEFPVNYVVGRIASPEAPARPGELFTVAADVTTEFPPNQSSFYRFWMSLEFLQGEKVVGEVSSGEIVGVQEKEALLAVTGETPPGATGVRVVLNGQNKYWSPLKNRAVANRLRLVKLSGKRGGAVVMETKSALPDQNETRTATFSVQSDWPDGTAIGISSSRGYSPRAVMLSGGKAEISLTYAVGEVGGATVTATVVDVIAEASLSDPHAGVLTIDAVRADGVTTPVLVRLSLDGKMLAGRYQSSVPGIFVTPPWSVDLAPGTWNLEISRGPQFETLKRELRIGSGKKEHLEDLEIQRRVDLRREGWYGGDADGDVFHGERIYTDVTPKTAAEIGQAMGLDWIGVGAWGDPKPRNWAEARAVTDALSSPEFLFMWTDERPKTKHGHACFVGLSGPDAEPLGWAWSGAKRPQENFEILQGIRAHGGATFVNHPLRWWMKVDQFNTNLYSSLPFDLCAAAALDGININEGMAQTQVWSLMLDHGYRVAATAGADFCLDRPSGPLPGQARMYCYIPDDVLSAKSLSDAVRKGHTIVSTGPVLSANIEGAPPGSMVAMGKTHTIQVAAWARGDKPDPLVRLELFAHGEVVAKRVLEEGGESATHQFEWTPAGDKDWVAVRLVSKGGWAMTSAFYAEGTGWRPSRPVDCEVTLDVRGLTSEETKQCKVEVWDRAPALPGAQQLRQWTLDKGGKLIVPVTSTLVLRAPGRQPREINVFDVLGVREIIDSIAAGERRGMPLLDWKTYQLVLDRCRAATVPVDF